MDELKKRIQAVIKKLEALEKRNKDIEKELNKLDNLIKIEKDKDCTRVVIDH
jgi:chaperonin cofactor prefoldin